MYYKPAALLIQFESIEKIDCVSWFKKLIMKVNQENWIGQMTDN